VLGVATEGGHTVYSGSQEAVLPNLASKLTDPPTPELAVEAEASRIAVQVTLTAFACEGMAVGGSSREHWW
jgi:hypothetical protein